MMKKMVKVTWVDSCSHSSWRDADCKGGTAQCVTVGFLHEDLESHVTVALSLHIDGDQVEGVSDIISIPRAAITNIVEVFTEEVGES